MENGLKIHAAQASLEMAKASHMQKKGTTGREDCSRGCTLLFSG
ncbi:hypothetical protein BN871_AF_00030 [Paenibacillus sp. P22]|nr:hypothetical protein BN871_AF_00030 [Paenibacillus sp. P22]